MNRRELILTAASTLAISGRTFGASAESGALPSAAEGLDEALWAALDEKIRNEWVKYTSTATEVEVRKDDSGEVLFLPFPFVSPTAPGSVFRFMFGWDTDFVNQALLAHGLTGQVRDHIRNYLFMIDRYGYMPNANARDLTSRSQTPLIADSLWRYYLKTFDRDLLLEAYPRLKRCYREYWCAPHHQTPLGLATNRDSGDQHLPPNLAAEAEVGLDWTPIFGGDARRCVPLLTNCALVRYARDLAKIGRALNLNAEARAFDGEALRRAALIRKYCWSEEAGFFLEYDYVLGRHLPYRSDCALWTLWAGVATRAQASRLVNNLALIEQPCGLSCTDKAYALPIAEKEYGLRCRVRPDGILGGEVGPEEVVGGDNPLQWMYPAGWAPSQLIAVEGLEAYGHSREAMRVARKFLGLLMQVHGGTGHLWEKYNVVEGSVVLPNARCGNIWMQGWTASAAAVLGRKVFRGSSLNPSA